VKCVHSSVCARRAKYSMYSSIRVQTKCVLYRALDSQRFWLIMSALLLKSRENIPFVFERDQIAMNFPGEVLH